MDDEEQRATTSPIFIGTNIDINMYIKAIS